MSSLQRESFNSIYIFTAQPRKTETQNWKILQFHIFRKWRQQIFIYTAMVGWLIGDLTRNSLLLWGSTGLEFRNILFSRPGLDQD